ncbi:putative nuclease HARBI1 [Tanacetum coccineum]
MRKRIVPVPLEQFGKGISLLIDVEDATLLLHAFTSTISRTQRTLVDRYRYGAHYRLVAAYFIDNSMYAEDTFRIDCTRKLGIFPLMKCTSAIRQLAYNVVPYQLDEHQQIGVKTSRDCLDAFYVRKHWLWAQCPNAYCAHLCRGDSGSASFILLEAVASQELWNWHAFFGVVGSSNDINVIRQPPLINDLKIGKAPEVPFMANNVDYR